MEHSQGRIAAAFVEARRFSLSSRLLKTLGTVTMVCALAVSSAVGQEARQDDEHALALKLPNPVASLISVPFQNNFE